MLKIMPALKHYFAKEANARTPAKSSPFLSEQQVKEFFNW